jgi:hypothetical protein
MLVRLEYRLLDEANHFPVLYHYSSIDKDEVSLRFACDYLVKGHMVYEKTSCAVEPDCYVIYVKPSAEEQAVDYEHTEVERLGKIRLELREYREGTFRYPLIHTYYFADDDDVLLHLQSDYLYLSGHEWEKMSTEVDEDRKVYVYYAKPAT